MTRILGNVLDPIHSELSPHIWDNAASTHPVLKPQHRKWIKATIYGALSKAGYTDIEKWLHLVLTGSLTTYQYSEASDCDISLFVDAKLLPEWSRGEMIGIMVGKVDGTTLPGTPFVMQDFVVPSGIKPDDLYKPGLRSGYDLDTEKWLVPPERDHVRDVEKEENGFYVYALQMADKMESLLKYEPDKAVTFWHQIHHRRQQDQKRGKGDFAESNIVYKFLANRGLFPRISEVSGEYIAKTAMPRVKEWLPMYHVVSPERVPQVEQKGIAAPAYLWADPEMAREYAEERLPQGHHLYEVQPEAPLEPDGEFEPFEGGNMAWISPTPIGPHQLKHVAKTKKVSGGDWFAPSYMIPDDAKEQIHQWVQQQQWPEGTKLPEPEKYHVTGLYSPSGFSDEGHQQWAQSKSGAVYPAQTTGVDAFTPSGENTHAPIVLRVYNPELIQHTEQMMQEAKERGLPISEFPGGYKPHITVAHSPDQVQLEHPHLSFPVGPLRDLHGYYDELKSAKTRLNSATMPEVAKFVYHPLHNRLFMGEMGKEEGQMPSHSQLATMSGWDPKELTYGQVSKNGYGETFGRPKIKGFGQGGGMNQYAQEYRTQEALRRAVPGVKFTKGQDLLNPEWELPGDPEVQYVGQPPMVEADPNAPAPAQWEF